MKLGLFVNKNSTENWLNNLNCASNSDCVMTQRAHNQRWGSPAIIPQAAGKWRRSPFGNTDRLGAVVLDFSLNVASWGLTGSAARRSKQVNEQKDPPFQDRLNAMIAIPGQGV
jgi:hypothetical protein